MSQTVYACILGLALAALPIARASDAPHAAPKHESHPKAEAHTKPEAHAQPEEHAKVVEHAKAEEHASKPAEQAHSEHRAPPTEHAKNAKTGFLAKTFHTFTHFFESLNEKANRIRQAEEENVRLKQENASLRLALETRAFESRAKSASERTQTYANRLERETWALVGRTAAGIHYEIPSSLQPAQIYTLGVDYFHAGEDEKAAKIFTFLAGLEDGEYNAPEHLLLNGVVWYRLDNYRIADAYFQKIATAQGATDRQKAQARIWRALIAERKGDHPGAQEMLKSLLAHHPKAPEIQLVNPVKEESRAPASKKPHH